MTEDYIQMGDFYMDRDTPEPVQVIINQEYRARLHGNAERIRVFYGDHITGRDWLEEHNTMGTIGRSTGTKKIPLLINNSRSLGGGALLTSCIVKITKGGKVLYMHPHYHQPALTIFEESRENVVILVCGMVHARFSGPKASQKAENYYKFLKGLRNSK